MHTLTVCFEGVQTNLSLQWKEFQGVKSAFDRVRNSAPTETLEIADDYGHIACFQKSRILTFLLSDVAAEFQSIGDKSIQQAREQKKTNMRAESDPILNMTLHHTPKLVS